MTRDSARLVALPFALALAAVLGGACGTSSSRGFDPNGGGGADGSAAGDGAGALGDSGTFGEGGGAGEGGGPKAPGCNDPKCACAAAGGAWNGTSCTLSENPGNVSAATQGQLGGSGTADGGFKFVYPYDQTVFPRGLLSPTLQWDGAAADAILVHVHAPTIDYKGYFSGGSPLRARPSDAAWLAITLAATGTDPLTVDVTKVSAGKVTGPISETWKIAQGSLRGIIYYETYGSAILGGIASVGIMKIAPGAKQPVPVASGCGNVCHTASADGSTLVSASGFAGVTSVSYSLKGGLTVKMQQNNQAFVYGGLYPDGSFVMSATNYRTWMGGPSRLVDTSNGGLIAAPGWDNAITNAAMPTFSPDGKRIAFNHEDTGHGHSLATMRFDVGTKSFSALTDVVDDPAHYLGWPAFTPDGASLVYHSGSSAAFETDADPDAGTPSTGDLYAVDIASKTAARLDKLDGYSGNGTYLPAADPDLNFAPTVLPEAVGGYFWVVFTSHRSYGNTLPSKDNYDTNGKLWVAAFDVGAPPGADPSHPAFYLDGQEATADNLRGFWVLSPCEDDGTSCQSGDECCGGYCVPLPSGPVCAATPTGCANEYDKCKVSADCCNGLECINGKCATPPPR